LADVDNAAKPVASSVAVLLADADVLLDVVPLDTVVLGLVFAAFAAEIVVLPVVLPVVDVPVDELVTYGGSKC
jgi:hypothetical protein